MTEMTTNMSLLAEVKSEATFPEITNENILIKSELLENCYVNGQQESLEVGLKRKETDWPESFTDQNNNSYDQQQTPMTLTTSNGTVSK